MADSNESQEASLLVVMERGNMNVCLHLLFPLRQVNHLSRAEVPKTEYDAGNGERQPTCLDLKGCVMPISAEDGTV